ncbi:unnamed protein product [Durusdinium trenchii]|uniref:Protein S-acyltransferase n=1 Tax=Durusdinium trenchii TaxID=1381693 RepID=A0ABP0IAD9_9DINO
MMHVTWLPWSGQLASLPHAAPESLAVAAAESLAVATEVLGPRASLNLGSTRDDAGRSAVNQREKDAKEAAARPTFDDGSAAPCPESAQHERPVKQHGARYASRSWLVQSRSSASSVRLFGDVNWLLRRHILRADEHLLLQQMAPSLLVTFKTFGGWKTAFRLETSLTKSVMPKDSRLFCGLFTKWQPKRCLGLADGWPLQEAAADWCAPAITAFYQHPCIAFNRAYIMGMVVLIVYAINVILLSTCAYLLYYYLDSKSHKPIYRTWAVILHGLGTFLMLCAVAGYTAFAMTSLDHIGPFSPGL